MMGANAYGPQKISKWLKDHRGEIRLYDKFGLNKTWKYADLNSSHGDPAQRFPGTVLCPNDYVTTGDSTTVAQGGVGKGIAGAVAYPTDSGWPAIQYRALKMTFALGVDQFWVPFSLDTTAKKINEWSSGYKHASFLYFSDIYWRWDLDMRKAGDGMCYFNTSRRSVGIGEDAGRNWPPSGQFACNDGGRTFGTQSHPPCDPTSRSACQTFWGDSKACSGPVNGGVRCFQICTQQGSTDQCDSSTKTVNGSSGVASVQAFCGGARNTTASSGELTR